MTALQPVWTPDDFDATCAAVAMQEPVMLPVQNREHLVDKVLAELQIEVERPSVVPPATRGRRYRGQHRANKFRPTVADLRDGGAR